MYGIVKFLDENDAPGIVCMKWVSENRTICVYPNVKTNEARDRMLKKNADPNPDWSPCRIKLLREFNSFSSASLQLTKAEETSNLESDDEVRHKRLKRKRRLCYPGEDSEEDSVSLIQPATKNCNNPLSSSPNLPYPVPPTQHEHSIPFSPSTTLIPSPPSQATVGRSQLEGLLPSHLKESSSFSTQAVMNGRLLSWMADISSKVAKLEEKMDTMLQLLERRKVPEMEIYSNEDLSMLGSLPVTTNGNFILLNQKLSEESLHHLLIRILISVGGKDMRSYIHNMLRRVLSDEVAEMYSLSGKSTNKSIVKKNFLVTDVSKSIFSACRRIFKDEATDVKIKEAIADWLHQAKVRKNRRIQRNERKNEKYCNSLFESEENEEMFMNGTNY